MLLSRPTTLKTPTLGLTLLTTEDHLQESAGSPTHKRRETLPSTMSSMETGPTTTSETTAWCGPSPRAETSMMSRSRTHSSKTKSGILATSPARMKPQTLTYPSQLLWSTSGSSTVKMGAGNLRWSTALVRLPDNSLFLWEELTLLATIYTLTRPPKNSLGFSS